MESFGPTVIMIAGPNGAGKTSFANQYIALLPDIFTYVNADDIARDLAGAGETNNLDIKAGRLMLRMVDGLVAGGQNFVFETTLASLTYARKIPQWQKRGYRGVLYYLRLTDADTAIARVWKRVAAGGHSIPEQVIRQRFDKSTAYLLDYRELVDEWHLFDSREGHFELDASGKRIKS